MKMFKCKNCNGIGGWNISVSCSPEDTMFISDGESMEMGWKDCFYCNGAGKLTKERLKEVNKIKGRKNDIFNR